MIRLELWTLAFNVALAAAPVFAQTQVDLRSQSKTVDFSTAPSTKPFSTGTVLPATCSVGQAFFNTSAASGSNWFGCTATNIWTLEGGGSGGGAMVPGISVSAAGAVMTIGSTCSTSAPCNIRVGSTVFAFLGPANATLATGSSGTAFVYVDSAGNLSVGNNFSTNLTCASGCVAVNPISAFPADSVPLWTWTVSAGVWNSSGGTDQRAFLSSKVVACGANLQCANSGTVLTISNTASGGSGSGLTVPIVDFADHSSTATSSQQTLSTLTLPAAKMSVNNQYAILAISGIQGTSNNTISLRFGSTAILIGNNTSSFGLGTGNAFTVECKVIRTAANAQKISCVSAIGPNLASPYVNVTTGVEDLTAAVLITMTANTNGAAADVVLRTFEFRPINF